MLLESRWGARSGTSGKPVPPLTTAQLSRQYYPLSLLPRGPVENFTAIHPGARG